MSIILLVKDDFIAAFSNGKQTVKNYLFIINICEIVVYRISAWLIYTGFYISI